MARSSSARRRHFADAGWRQPAFHLRRTECYGPGRARPPYYLAMSFADRLILWLHIAVAIFTIGPVALAISSTPRAIRHRDIPVLRYLSRITLIFTGASLLVLVFGIVLGNIVHAFSRPWLTVSMTLFVVAIVLLVLIVRDQRKAIRALAELTAEGEAGRGAGRQD